MPATRPNPPGPRHQASPGEAALIRAGWALVADHTDRLAANTFARLFTTNPAARDLFAVDMAGQRRRLIDAVRAVVAAADQPARLRQHLADVGRGCATLGAHPEQVHAAGAALLWALADTAGPAWTPPICAAWCATVGRAVAELHAAASAAGCWPATVVAHRRIGDDTATFTVQPDRPYPYRAGQHAALRLLRPGYDVWRPMSIASAPRTSGRLTFWARTVPGGLMSPALVAHLRAGDRLLLGPPLGHNLVVDRRFTGGLVLVAGGIGAAAIRGVLEQVARWDHPPSVRAYLGVGGPGDAALLANLEGVARVLRDVRAVTGVAAGDSQGFPGGLVGQVAQAAAAAEARRVDQRGVPEILGGRQHVLLAGPRRMVTHATRCFAELGVPAERIHTDGACIAGGPAYACTLAP